MKKFKILTAAILFLGTVNLFAATVSITNTSGNATYDTVISNLESTVNSSGDLNFLGDNKDFATSMGDAAQFTTSTATFNGYQNYTLFAVSVGWGVGAIIPESRELDKLEDDLRKDGDIEGGAGSLITLNIGVNLGLFIDNLYANIVIGGLPKTEISDGLEAKQFALGLGLNYKLFDSIGVMGGLAKWRGISLGTGFYYINSQTSYSFELGEQTASGGGYDAKLNPLVQFDSDIKIYKIPIEAVTSFQALWLMNFTLGAGADIVFGHSNFDLNATSDVYRADTGEKIGKAKLVGADTESNPTTFKFKIITGLGFNFGPIKIDIPVVYYPSNGVFAGITTGFVF